MALSQRRQEKTSCVLCILTPTSAHRIFLSPSCLAAVGMGKVAGSGQGEEVEVVGGADSEGRGSLEGETAGELEKGDPSSNHPDIRPWFGQKKMAADVLSVNPYCPVRRGPGGKEGPAMNLIAIHDVG